MGKFLLRYLTLILFFFLFFVIHGQKGSPITEFIQISDSLQYEQVAKSLNEELRGLEGRNISIESLDSIIEIGEKLNSITGLGYVYNAKGLVQQEKGDYDKGLKSFQTSKEYFLTAKDSNGLKFVYKGLADIEFLRANYNKSINYGIEEKKYIQSKDSLALARWYNRLGVINDAIKDFESAEKAFSQSILYSTTTDIDFMVLTSANLARLYGNQQKLDKAAVVLENAILRSRRENKKKYIHYAYNTLAEVYHRKKFFKMARAYIDTAYAITKKSGLEYDMHLANITKAEIELELRNYKSSEQLLDESTSYFKSIDAKPFLFYNYNLYFKLDSSRGNLKGALGWLKKYKELSDKRRMEDSAKQMQNIEKEFNAEIEKLQIIQQQEIVAQQTKSDLFKFRMLTWVAIVGLLISLFFIYQVFKASKERKRIVKSLQESNDIKGKLFAVISHHLKDEMHGIESSLRLMNNDLVSTEDVKEILPLLVQKTNETSIMLNNLLIWSKSQMNELKPSPVSFVLADLIDTKFAFFGPKLKEKNITFNTNLDASEMYADKDMVIVVAQNLMSNAIKFCDSGDTITLSSEEKEDDVEIILSDTGVGIAPENISKLFTEETYSTLGSQNESGTGLGLRICKELVELNNGNIRVDSSLGKGTSFTILVPKG